MLGSWESNFIKQPFLTYCAYCSFISVLFIEGDTEAKTTGFTSFAWANLQFSGRVTLVNRFLNAVSEIVSLKATDTTFLRCRFSPVFIGLNVGFREFFEDWPHHGIIFWLTCCCHWRWWGLLIRQKGSCRLAFILNVMDIDPIPSIIHFIIFPRIWIIRIFWVISALRSQFIGIMQRSHPSNCLCQLIGLLYLTFRVFMPMEVRVICKTSVKALNITLLISMISPAARELEVV